MKNIELEIVVNLNLSENTATINLSENKTLDELMKVNSMGVYLGIGDDEDSCCLSNVNSPKQEDTLLHYALEVDKVDLHDEPHVMVALEFFEDSFVATEVMPINEKTTALRYIMSLPT